MLLIDEPAGPEIYTYHIFHALAEIDNLNTYTIYLDKTPPEGYFENLVSENKNFTYKVLPSFPSWTQFHLAFELYRNPVDVFFTPVHTMPIIRSGNTKIVGMIHGLEYLTNFSNNMMFRSSPVRFLARNADFLIVPSEYTKSTVLDMPWGVLESKIKVVAEGVGEIFYKREEPEISSVLSRYGIEKGQYIISISTIQPRKNYPALIEAFSRVSKIRDELKLAICGKKGWEYEQALEAPTKFGIQNKVLFLGRVPDEDLPALISGSALFVSASLEEGFGLPLLESMACETLAAVSDIPAFKTLADKTAFYFDPQNVDSITDVLTHALEASNSFEMVERAKKLSLEYTWEKSASKTLEVFENVIKK